MEVGVGVGVGVVMVVVVVVVVVQVPLCHSQSHHMSSNEPCKR